MAEQYNIHQAKTHLSKLVERAAAGDEIIIARAGKPVAKLVKWSPPPCTRQLGLFAGQIHIADDFDDLPDELLAAFEGD